MGCCVEGADQLSRGVLQFRSLGVARRGVFEWDGWMEESVTAIDKVARNWLQNDWRLQKKLSFVALQVRDSLALDCGRWVVGRSPITPAAIQRWFEG